MARHSTGVLVALLLSLFAGESCAATVEKFDVAIDQAINALSNLRLRESISRYLAEDGKIRQREAVEADVAFADGTEQYSTVRSGNRIYHHLSEVNGLWSFRELTTVLRTTQDLIRNSRAVSVEEAGDGAVASFRAAPEDRLWFFTAGGRMVWLGFTGTLRMRVSTGQITSLTWTSDAEAPGSSADGVQLEVNFDATSMSGRMETVPRRSMYQVVKAGRRRKEWNVTSYEVLEQRLDRGPEAGE